MYGSCIPYSVCVCIVLILNSISYTDGEYDFVDRSSWALLLQAHNCVCNHYS